jgi:hemerythrin superfamily protein
MLPGQRAGRTAPRAHPRFRWPTSGTDWPGPIRFGPGRSAPAPISGEGIEMFPGEETAGQQDAVSLLKEDHAKVERLFAQYQGLSGDGDPNRRRALVDQMVVELRLHASLEEQAFYPSVREVIADGGSLVQESLQEHADAKELLTDLQEASPEDPRFHAKVETLIRDVRHHVNEEEGEMFPKLQRAVGESWLLELGREMERTKLRLRSEAAGAGPVPAEAQSLSPVLTPGGPPSMREAGGRPARARGAGPKRATATKSPAKAAAAKGPTAQKGAARKATTAKARSTTSRGPRPRVPYHLPGDPDGGRTLAGREEGRHPGLQHPRQEARSRCSREGAGSEAEARPARRARRGRENPGRVHLRIGPAPVSRLIVRPGRFCRAGDLGPAEVRRSDGLAQHGTCHHRVSGHAELAIVPDG